MRVMIFGLRRQSEAPTALSEARESASLPDESVAQPMVAAKAGIQLKPGTVGKRRRRFTLATLAAHSKWAPLVVIHASRCGSGTVSILFG